MSNPPICLCFSGYPGTGKSTLARAWAAQTGAIWLRIDTIERGLAASCLKLSDAMDGAYHIAAAQALDHLAMGQSVVIDAVNPVPHTRAINHHARTQSSALWVDIEVRCSDRRQHRARVEDRYADAPDDPRVPNWAQVQAREFEDWAPPVPTLDTAGQTVEASTQALLQLLEQTRH